MTIRGTSRAGSDHRIAGRAGRPAASGRSAVLATGTPASIRVVRPDGHLAGTADRSGITHRAAAHPARDWARADQIPNSRGQAVSGHAPRIQVTAAPRALIITRPNDRIGARLKPDTTAP
jgi:hypothetical protein